MIVHSAWLGSSPQLLDIATAIKCDPVSEEARIHVVLSSPQPTGFADAGRQPRHPIQFEVDPHSWTATSNLPQADDQAIVNGFLGSLPSSHRDSLRQMAGYRRDAYRKLKPFSTSTELRRNANLVYWTEFEAENQLPETVFDQFSDGLRFYLVSDCYCLKSMCDCRSAHLAFHRISQDMTGVDVCLVRLSLDNGELQLEHISGDRVEAMGMIGRWQSNRLNLFLPELNWRYAKMRGSATTGTSRRLDSPRPASDSANRKARRKNRKGR
jgi:hypothetical protein